MSLSSLTHFVQVRTGPGFNYGKSWETMAGFDGIEAAKSYMSSCRRYARGMREYRVVTLQELEALA